MCHLRLALALDSSPLRRMKFILVHVLRLPLLQLLVHRLLLCRLK
jgi:hypothetical protein